MHIQIARKIQEMDNEGITGYFKDNSLSGELLFLRRDEWHEYHTMSDETNSTLAIAIYFWNCVTTKWSGFISYTVPDDI